MDNEADERLSGVFDVDDDDVQDSEALARLGVRCIFDLLCKRRSRVGCCIATEERRLWLWTIRLLPRAACRESLRFSLEEDDAGRLIVESDTGHLTIVWWCCWAILNVIRDNSGMHFARIYSEELSASSCIELPGHSKDQVVLERYVEKVETTMSRPHLRIADSLAS